MGIGSKVLTSTSLGTGVTRTKIGSYNLPSWCRSVLSVIPIIADITPTAAQSIMAKLELESDSLGLKPFEVLAPPIGSGLGATYNTLTGKDKYLGVITKGTTDWGTTVLYAAGILGAAYVVSSLFGGKK